MDEIMQVCKYYECIGKCLAEKEIGPCVGYCDRYEPIETEETEDPVDLESTVEKDFHKWLKEESKKLNSDADHFGELLGKVIFGKRIK